MKYQWNWPLLSQFKKALRKIDGFYFFIINYIYVVIFFLIEIGISYIFDHGEIGNTPTYIGLGLWFGPAVLSILGIMTYYSYKGVRYLYMNRPRRVLVSSPDIRQVYAHKD